MCTDWCIIDWFCRWYARYSTAKINLVQVSLIFSKISFCLTVHCGPYKCIINIALQMLPMVYVHVEYCLSVEVK